MTVKELVRTLQAMMDSGVVSPEGEIEVHDVINDASYEIIGYDLYPDGSVYLKAREK